MQICDAYNRLIRSSIYLLFFFNSSPPDKCFGRKYFWKQQILPVTYASLKQSNVVPLLKSLKKHADQAVRKQSKAVISHWKTALVVSFMLVSAFVYGYVCVLFF